MTTTEEARNKARTLRKIIDAKRIAKNKLARGMRRKLIQLFAVATIATSIAPAANAQSRGNSNQGKRYEYIQQPDGSFKMVEVTNNRQATTQQSYSKASSGQQSVAEIFNSLPAYTRAEIQEKGLQILPEFQGGRTTGLNRPEAGVIYACVVQDPCNENQVIFMRPAKGIYPAGSRDFRPLDNQYYSKEKAYYMMITGTGPYEARVEYAQTRENAQRERYNEQRSRQDDIYMDQRDVRQDREETHVKIQKDTGYGKANGVMDGIDDVDRTINRGVRTVENGVNTVKRSVKTVKRIFGRD